MSLFQEEFPFMNEEESAAVSAMEAATAPSSSSGNKENKEFADDLYKKWTKSKGLGRFLTVRGWLESGKISVDIGETGDGGLKKHTQVWANAVSLATYLDAVRLGRAAELYPAAGGGNTPESFVYYGGGSQDGRPISRVLKISYWTAGKDSPPDPTSFAWKTGHFAARKSDTGAFIPDMSKPLSINLIKMTRAEMAEMATILQLALVNHASNTEPKQWITQITGKRK